VGFIPEKHVAARVGRRLDPGLDQGAELGVAGTGVTHSLARGKDLAGIRVLHDELGEGLAAEDAADGPGSVVNLQPHLVAQSRDVLHVFLIVIKVGLVEGVHHEVALLFLDFLEIFFHMGKDPG